MTPAGTAAVVAAHVDAEHGNRVPGIMATISRRDVHYAILTSAAPPDLMLATTRAEAQAYYERDRTRWNHVRSDHLAEINGEWFAFHDSVGYLAPVDGGPPFRPHSAVLFPVWEDGIIGEVVWLRSPAEASLADQGEATLAVAERLDQFMAAWAAGDAARVVAMVDPDFVLVARNLRLDSEPATLAVGRGVEDLAAQVAAAAEERIGEERRIALAVTDWYAFAVHRQRVVRRGGRFDRERAVLLPAAPGGRIRAWLSYAIERPAG